MANVTAAVGNYAGKAALPYVYPAIMAADSIANGYVDIRTNVVGTAVLRKLSGAAARARTCGFTGQSGLLSEVPLNAKSLEVKLEFCHSDLVATWEAEQMTNGRTAPADFKSAAAQYVAAEAARAIELNTWQGQYDADGTSAGTAAVSAFKGILKQIVDASPVYEKTVSGAFTKTNILDNFADLLARTPPDVGGQEETLIYCSPATRGILYSAIADAYGAVHLTQEQRYAGYRIVTPRGFANDTLLIGQPSNFVFGTDLTGSNTNVAAGVVDLNETTLGDTVRAMVAFTAGVAVVDHDSYGVIRRSS